MATGNTAQCKILIFMVTSVPGRPIYVYKNTQTRKKKKKAMKSILILSPRGSKRGQEEYRSEREKVFGINIASFYIRPFLQEKW